MEVMLDWKAIGVIVTLLLAWSSALVGAIKWLIDKYSDHMDERFETLQRHDIAEQQRLESVMRDLAEFRLEVSRDYVRREDWIRFSGQIDAKLDRLYERFEWLVKSFRRGDERPGGPS
jgi:hypothetical protein